MKKTAIETFIEKAVEGKAWPDYELTYIQDDAVLLKSREHPGRSKALVVAEVLLNPKSFQAVGKVEGWAHVSAYCRAGNHKSCSHGTGCDCWCKYMHRLIDALAEGKTIEEFLTTLFV